MIIPKYEQTGLNYQCLCDSAYFTPKDDTLVVIATTTPRRTLDLKDNILRRQSFNKHAKLVCFGCTGGCKYTNYIEQYKGVPSEDTD